MFIDGFFTGVLTVMLLIVASAAMYNRERKNAKPKARPEPERHFRNPWDLPL